MWAAGEEPVRASDLEALRVWHWDGRHRSFWTLMPHPLFGPQLSPLCLPPLSGPIPDHSPRTAGQAHSRGPTNQRYTAQPSPAQPIITLYSPMPLEPTLFTLGAEAKAHSLPFPVHMCLGEPAPRLFLLLLGNVYIHPTAKVAPSAVVRSGPNLREKLLGLVGIPRDSAWVLVCVFAFIHLLCGLEHPHIPALSWYDGPLHSWAPMSPLGRG